MGRGLWVMGFGFGLTWAFFRVFSGLITWLQRFLGIFWVDRCIMGQASIEVASTFFWVDHRRFSGYFRWPGFQIGGVDLLIGGLGGGSNWFVCSSVCVAVADRCVWLY